MTKERFGGFPARADFTPVPTLFLTGLAPRIDDPAELKVSLYVMQALHRKKGYPRFTSSDEMAADGVLMAALDGGTAPPAETLRRALDLAVERGTFIQLKVTDREGRSQEVYLLNDDPGRRAVAKWRDGELALPAVAAVAPAPAPVGRPNIFTLYEENIGMLTPIIAEELRAAEKAYPPEWIEDAFREAVTLNKRNWRYIARILENWSTEGRDHGKPGGRPQRGARPEDYYKGKFGHLVGR